MEAKLCLAGDKDGVDFLFAVIANNEHEIRQSREKERSQNTNTLPCSEYEHGKVEQGLGA
jgi:hypothetical protein